MVAPVRAFAVFSDSANKYYPPKKSAIPKVWTRQSDAQAFIDDFNYWRDWHRYHYPKLERDDTTDLRVVTVEVTLVQEEAK